MTDRPRSTRLAAWIYARLLRAIPAEIREPYGADMRATFDTQADAAVARGQAALVFIFVREVADLARACLSTWSFSMADLVAPPTFRQFRQAVRSLLRRPAFGLAAIATLALGTAATTTIFAIVDTVLLRPLPYPDAGRLVTVYESATTSSSKTSLIAPARLADWARMSQAFDGLSGQYVENVTDTSGADPERLEGRRVMPGFFDVYGTAPLEGRTFSPLEERFNGPGAAVISDAFWARRYQRAPSAIGTSLVIGGSPFTIVGVMPATFASAPTDVWLPAQVSPGLMRVREARFLSGVARLKPGVTIDQASSDLATVQAALARQFPESDAGWGVQLRSMRDARVGGSARTLWLVFAAVGLLWLIGVANMAGLVLVQLKRRGRELAIRAAIGGSRGQIAGVVMHEVLLIASAGGVAGALAASWLITLVPAVFTALPRLAELRFDWRAALFAASSCIAAAVVFGVWPALAMTRTKSTGLARAVGSGERNTAGGRHGLQQALVVAQVALSLLLVGSAALIARTYVNLTRVNVGFDATGVLTFHVGARWDEDRVRVGQFQQRLLNAIHDVPGVESAAFVNFLPLTGATLRYQVTVDGVTGPERGGAMTAGARMMSPDYPRVMHAPLLEGESCPALTVDDTATAHVMVNRAFAETFAPGQPLAGRELRILQNPGAPLTISGVTENMIEDGAGTSAAPYIYTCEAAGSWPDPEYVVRTSDAAGFSQSLRQVVKTLDPRRAVFGMMPLERVAAASLDEPRINAGMLGGFALAALLLAALGLYSLFMLLVGESAREIGVRLALGARPGRIVADVCWRAGRLLLAGIAAGLALTIAAETVLRAALFGVSPLDPITLVGATLTLCAVSAIAIAVPAARAARVDPLLAMKAD